MAGSLWDSDSDVTQNAHNQRNGNTMNYLAWLLVTTSMGPLLAETKPVVYERFEKAAAVTPHRGVTWVEDVVGYGIFGAAEAVKQDSWPAGHEWHGDVAYPFVDNVLGGHAAKMSCRRSRPMAESRQVPEKEPLISANER